MHFQEELIRAGDEIHRHKVLVGNARATGPILMDQFAIEPNLHGIIAAYSEDAPGLLRHVDFGPGVSDGKIARSVAGFKINDIV